MNLLENGENSIVLKVSYDETVECVRAIRRIYHELKAVLPSGIVSIRPALDTLLIEFTDDISMEKVKEWILHPTSETQAEEKNEKIIRIPVCYEPDFGLDLIPVSRLTGLTREEIVQYHTSSIYEVWMLGFMPGFPYLGNLNQRLHLPRKVTPAPFLPAGSVAIAEEFSGIYPFDSPGGWHVIGRTPLRITDYSRENPFLFRYGLKVQFYPISEKEFYDYPTL